MQPPQSTSGTVHKALTALDLVASFQRPVRFNEVHQASQLPKGTLYRMLQSLRSEGMLSYDESQQTYALGIRLMRLAHAAWTQFSLAPIAGPFLDAVSKSTGETVHLAQLDDSQVLYVDKRHAERSVDMFAQTGRIGPSYCTGIGKAMLAFLPERDLAQAVRKQSFHRYTAHTLTTPDALLQDLARIRACGYALDREEHEPGIICIAVPILNASQQVIGAMSVTSTILRTSLEHLEALYPELLTVSRNIANAAKHWRFPVEQTPTE